MDELMICIKISHRMAAVPIVEADTPTLDQGETEERPSPVPNASKIRDNAAVTKPPPITAAQDTPDEFASLLTEVSATGSIGGCRFWNLFHATFLPSCSG
jgi:hypothetical protein